MSKKKNVFISHYNKDDKHLHSLIDRLNKKGSLVSTKKS